MAVFVHEAIKSVTLCIGLGFVYKMSLCYLLLNTMMLYVVEHSLCCHREVAILVSPTPLQPSDKGSVIIGGRLSIQGDPLFRKSEQIRDKLNVINNLMMMYHVVITPTTVR